MFGTERPDSDFDVKQVHLPDARAIILGSRDSLRLTDPRDPLRDTETHSLRKFFAMLGEGQTLALEMLFAPRNAHLQAPMPLWTAIVAERPRLISRKVTAFVGYCRRQAETYAAKGDRLDTLLAADAMIEAAIAAHGAGARLDDIWNEIVEFTTSHDNAAIFELQSVGEPLSHWEIFGRSIPETAPLRVARDRCRR